MGYVFPFSVLPDSFGGGMTVEGIHPAVIEKILEHLKERSISNNSAERPRDERR